MHMVPHTYGSTHQEFTRTSLHSHRIPHIVIGFHTHGQVSGTREMEIAEAQIHPVTHTLDAAELDISEVLEELTTSHTIIGGVINTDG